jgi:hypothetical protein
MLGSTALKILLFVMTAPLIIPCIGLIACNQIFVFRTGYVASKYTLTETDYKGREFNNYIITIYDKIPDDLFSQDFKMNEFYVDYKTYKKAEIFYRIKIPFTAKRISWD